MAKSGLSRSLIACTALVLAGFAQVSLVSAAGGTSYADGATGAVAATFEIVKIVPGATAATDAIFPATLAGANENEVSAVLSFESEADTTNMDSIAALTTLSNVYVTGAVNNGASVDLQFKLCNASACDDITNAKATAAIEGDKLETIGISSIENATDTTALNDLKLATGSLANTLWLRHIGTSSESKVAIGCGSSIKFTYKWADDAGVQTIPAHDADTANPAIAACACEVSGSPTKGEDSISIPVKLEGTLASSISIHFLKKTSAAVTAATKDANITDSDLEPITSLKKTTATADDKKLTYQWDGTSSTAITAESFDGGDGIFVFSPTGAKTGTGADSVTKLTVTTPSKDNAWTDWQNYCDDNEVWLKVNCHGAASGARASTGLTPASTQLLLGTAQKVVKSTICDGGDGSGGSGGGSNAVNLFNATAALIIAAMSALL